MKKSAKHLTIKSFIAAMLLFILSCTQLPTNNSVQTNSGYRPTESSICFIGGGWENT